MEIMQLKKKNIVLRKILLKKIIFEVSVQQNLTWVELNINQFHGLFKGTVA